ncbi:MAG: hypothetical protein WBM07_02365 [Chitinivibrionales bacterium]
MFSSLNYKLLGLSVLLLILGYVLLGQGPVTNPLSLNVAPVVLVAVYLFLIPFAIIVGGKEEKKK